MQMEHGVRNINRKWKDFFHQNIHEVVTEICCINKRPDIKNIHTHLAKRDNLQELSG